MCAPTQCAKHVTVPLGVVDGYKQDGGGLCEQLQAGFVCHTAVAAFKLAHVSLKVLDLVLLGHRAIDFVKDLLFRVVWVS